MEPVDIVAMKNLIITVIAIIAGFMIFQKMDPAAGFVQPVAAAGERSGSGIRKYEFSNLFERDKAFSSLAKEGYYTVIEGYINTCSICKALEADFPAFLNKRKDVLIRRVHFPEGGSSVSFSGDSQEEINEQIAEYHERLGRYNFNHVKKTDAGYQLSVCGTPHIEVYGPDRQLIATDTCGERNLKSGLKFLRNWIKAEKG